MQVKDLFQLLSVGELSNLAISGEGSGTIRTKDHLKLISYVNQGLEALHKRFIIKTDDLLIEEVDFITSYHLRPEYAVSSGSNQRYKYIIDGGKPFHGGVVRVLEVWDALTGKALVLNDPGNSESLFTPSPLILQDPNPITRNNLSVIYQSNAKKLEYVGLSEDKALAQDIDLPDFFHQALQLYSAYKVFSHMTSQEAGIKSQEFLTLYENECNEIEANDLVAQSQSFTHTKLNERGFV